MNKRIKNIVTVVVFAAFTLGVTVLCLATPDASHSLSERRELAQFPEVSAERLLSGEFSKDFESYSTDQFALRDGWRSLSTFIAKNIFQNRRFSKQKLIIREIIAIFARIHY